MTATVLHGEPLARELRNSIAETIKQRSQQQLRPPSLAVVLVGEDYASKLYIRAKKAACLEVGIKVQEHLMAANISEQELLDLIADLNHNDAIDAILVQLPLPEHIDTAKVVESIAAYKDVDGFHPYNIGRLAQGNPTVSPCTPRGIMRLLGATKVELKGKLATVVGTSNIVGKPMILELINAGVSVCACNKYTNDLKSALIQADIVIVAAGVPGLIQGQDLKPGVIAIDVGINRNSEGRVIGDLDYDSVVERASIITPVPGGVGPMTIASLLNNALLLNSRRL